MEEERYKLINWDHIADQLPKWDADYRIFADELESATVYRIENIFKDQAFTLEDKMGPLLKMKELKWYYHEKRFEKIIA